MPGILLIRQKTLHLPRRPPGLSHRHLSIELSMFPNNCMLICSIGPLTKDSLQTAAPFDTLGSLVEWEPDISAARLKRTRKHFIIPLDDEILAVINLVGYAWFFVLTAHGPSSMQRTTRMIFLRIRLLMALAGVYFYASTYWQDQQCGSFCDWFRFIHMATPFGPHQALLLSFISVLSLPRLSVLPFSCCQLALSLSFFLVTPSC